MADKNPFGGVAGSLYTPMSEDEQEVLSRLVEACDLDVHIVDWGWVRGVKASFGDLRLAVPITITFNRPQIPILVHYFDLELRTGAGQLLFRERQSAVYDNKPLAVGSGTTLTMVWDIAIKSMDPKLVKQIKPGARGLTSRWVDKDTGLMTQLGNTKMPAKEKALLRKLRQGEAANRQDTLKKLHKEAKKFER